MAIAVRYRLARVILLPWNQQVDEQRGDDSPCAVAVENVTRVDELLELAQAASATA